MDNLRFGKHASVMVRMTSRPGEGKQFIVTERSGSTKLIEIIEQLLASEVDSSHPGKTGDHEIGPSNYRASVLGSETVAGRDCLVLTLEPKTKSKYLVGGTAWVDKVTNGLVRLDGTTAASISLWIGKPHVVEDFSLIDGLWLPIHTISKSASLLLGESDLDIRYMNYQVNGKP
jgi:hypothetical protein